jgi:type VI secretion system protein ImpF
VLVGSVSQEPVNFDAVLQPSTLQYSIRKAGRAAATMATAASPVKET